MNPSKQRLLICSGSGTVTMDYFAPMLRELASNWEIDFLEGDFAPSPSGRRWMARFLADGIVTSFRLMPDPDRYGAWGYQRELLNLVTELKGRPFDVLLLGTDFYLADQYLVALARDIGARVVVLQTNLISPDILVRYLTSRHQTDRIEKIVLPKQSVLTRATKKLKAKLRRPFLLVRSKWERQIIPKILWGKTFPKSLYDRFAFTAGRGDVVLFYDELEAEAYRHAVPAVRKTLVVKHPARIPLTDKSDTAGKSEKLLVLFSSYTVEMADQRIDFWVRVISESTALAGLKEVHLRFHPRMHPSLTWPDRLKEKLKALPLTIVTIPAENPSLTELVHDYAGVLGAYSGALRTARAAADHIFVLGLIAGGELCTVEGPWVLGNSEGIEWIRSNETVQPKHVAVPSPADTNRPTIAEFLKMREKEAIAA